VLGAALGAWSDGVLGAALGVCWSGVEGVELCASAGKAINPHESARVKSDFLSIVVLLLISKVGVQRQWRRAETNGAISKFDVRRTARVVSKKEEKLCAAQTQAWQS
jgi:hypothetical protein